MDNTCGFARNVVQMHKSCHTELQRAKALDKQDETFSLRLIGPTLGLLAQVDSLRHKRTITTIPRTPVLFCSAHAARGRISRNHPLGAISRVIFYIGLDTQGWSY